MSLQEKWGMAFSQSNNRWLDHSWALDNAAIKRCLELDQCPMSRNTNPQCLAQWCILRFPEEKDMEILQ